MSKRKTKPPVTAVAQAAALANAVRVQAWLRIVETGKSSPSELAEYLDEPLANTAYHVRRLLDLELIEPAGTTQRRGAIEHYYKPRRTPADVWAELMPTRPGARVAAMGAALAGVLDEVVELEGEHILAGPSMHVAAAVDAVNRAGRALESLGADLEAIGAAA